MVDWAAAKIPLSIARRISKTLNHFQAPIFRTRNWGRKDKWHLFTAQHSQDHADWVAIANDRKFPAAFQQVKFAFLHFSNKTVAPNLTLHKCDRSAEHTAAFDSLAAKT